MTPTTTRASAGDPTRPGRAIAVWALLPVVVLAACGRSAPETAIVDDGGDPEIAGVSITSPDAVVTTVTTAPGETVPPTTEPAPPADILYTIQPGDTLSVIAGRYGIAIGDLAAHNGITDVDSIKPGEQLAIPAPPDASGPDTTGPDVTVAGQPDGTIEVTVVSQP